MPIVRVELLAGRTSELKAELGRQFTEVLERVAGVKPEATMVVFVDVAPHDWVIAGKASGPAPESLPGV